LPSDVGPIVFWYNKELCQKVGVDPTQIKEWDDFLENTIMPLAIFMTVKRRFT